MSQGEVKFKNGKEITTLPNGKIRVRTINNEKSLTQQQFKTDCDVNVILNKLMKGENVQFNQRKGTYGDFANSPSYEEAMQTIVTADETFMSLPSHLRTKFENSPQKFLDYLGDKDKLEESYKLGLRKKPVKVPNPTLDKLTELTELTKESVKNSKTKKTEG